MWAFFVGDFMAIQTVDLTVPGGDTPRSANTKINANFTDQTNAASRLVGTGTGNVMEVGAFGLGKNSIKTVSPDAIKVSSFESAFIASDPDNNTIRAYLTSAYSPDWVWQQRTEVLGANSPEYRLFYNGNAWTPWYKYLTSQNTTKDSNGFIKGASPIVDLYSDSVVLNDDAKQQGGITFQKLATGDYLVKGSLGFAQEGWYIEMPKDANGNVLVAVVYEQLANNDISIKTYAKRFDDETGDIVANLLKPRDIPAGRFISLRLHELQKEPPVMPTQDTSADAPAQTNNP